MQWRSRNKAAKDLNPMKKGEVMRLQPPTEKKNGQERQKALVQKTLPYTDRTKEELRKAVSFDGTEII